MLRWHGARSSNEEASKSAGLRDAPHHDHAISQRALTGTAVAAVLYKLINWLFAGARAVVA